MASSHEQSRKKIVLQKYRTEIRNTLSQCIEDVLPDLESSGAINIDQKDKLREYVEGKMPANAVDYLVDDHMKRPLSVESNENFVKLLEVMKKAPKCSPQCKALATIVEQDLKSDTSGDVDEVTKMLERLAKEKTKQIEELTDARTREWEKWPVRKLYPIDKYGPTPTDPKERPLGAPLFLAKGPNDELFVRDNYTQRLVVFNHQGDKLKSSRCIDCNCTGYITGIAVGTEYLYVADGSLDCIHKLRLNTGNCIQHIGSSGSGDHQFNSPNGLALDEAKSVLYVYDSDNHRIQIIQMQKDGSTSFTRFQLQGYRPTDIALNSDKDQLYITHHNNHIVQVLKTDGSQIGSFGDIGVKNPFGICTYLKKYSQAERVVISSTSDRAIYMFENGKLLSPYFSDDFNYPCGVAVMDNEQIVVASKDGNRLTVL